MNNVTRGGPHPVDHHVGLQIRQRRFALSMSQSTLADLVEITFQQIQKYERGTNRVSASMLYGIARALKVPPTYFFEGLATAGADGQAPEELAADQHLRELAVTPGGIEVAAFFPKLKPPVRRCIVSLLRHLAEGDGA